MSAEERSRLNGLIKKGKASVCRIRHANILLKADEGGPAWGDGQIAEAFSVTVQTGEEFLELYHISGKKVLTGERYHKGRQYKVQTALSNNSEVADY